MESDHPLIVRGRRCPCDCDENGALIYLRCPGCANIILLCDEIGNVFDNLDDPLASLPLVIWRSSGQHCPGCQTVLLTNFELATDQDLTRLGIGPDKYEAGDAYVSDSFRRLAMS